MATLPLEKRPVFSAQALALRPGEPPNWLAWHESAPAEVSGASSWDGDSNGWHQWRRHLERRRRPRPLVECIPHGERSLLWAIPADWCEPATATMIERLTALSATKWRKRNWAVDEARQWLAQFAKRSRDIEFALECLAWSHALPYLATAGGATLWWGMLEHLVVASRTQLPAREASDPLTDLLLCGELPVSLAYQLPEIAPCRELWEAGRRYSAQALASLIDRTGLPHARQLPHWRGLLASWVRMYELSRENGEPLWTDVIAAQLGASLVSAARWTRHDGGQYLSREPMAPGFVDVLEVGLPRLTRKCERSVAASAIKGLPQPEVAKVPRRLRAAVHCEGSELALLRADWEPGSATLAVAYHEAAVQLELSVAGETLWQGPWDVVLRSDGDLLAPQGVWEQVCWTSDKEADYLEIERTYRSGVRIQRHILLARKDRFALMADSVLAPPERKIEYQGMLPVADGVRCVPADETREVHLRGRRARATVLPLRLPEWRRDPRGGRLQSSPTGLTLAQKSAGGSLFAPLFVDLDKDRQNEELTWRQLTVAEQRVIQPTHQADGFRVQVGDQQWLVYRSLTGKANRTVLGQNVITEFLVARFRRKGTTRPILEIEIDDD
jgi:hypothetical protein